MDSANNIEALVASVATAKPRTPRKSNAKAVKPRKAKALETEPKIILAPILPADGTPVERPSTVPLAQAAKTLPAPAKKTMEQITNQIYLDAAQRIVALMDAGNSIWQKPWVAPCGHSRPYSASSGLPFSGFNRFSLMCEMLANEWSDARFMTYRQVQTMAASMANEGIKPEELPYVKAGTRGLPIYKFGFVEKKTPVLDAAGRPRLDGDGKPIVNIVRGRSYLRSYVVFPASAIANMPPPPGAEPAPVWAVRSQVEELIEKMGVPVKHEPGNRAFYSITTDSITMPERAQFKDTVDSNGHVSEAATDKFLSVLLHEISHSTGAKQRLARAMSGVHGSPSYAREDLTAETASCFLLAEIGLGSGSASSETTARTAAYLGSWRQAILDDPKSLMTAFAEAEKAADWVMQRHPIQLEAAAKLASEGQAMRNGLDSTIAARAVEELAPCAAWVIPSGLAQLSGPAMQPM